MSREINLLIAGGRTGGRSWLMPLPCVRCHGAREITVRAPGCDHNGNCPCGGVEVTCEHCLATPGYEPCAECGERPATYTHEYAGGEPICGSCLAERLAEALTVAGGGR